MYTRNDFCEIHKGPEHNWDMELLERIRQEYNQRFTNDYLPRGASQAPYHRAVGGKTKTHPCMQISETAFAALCYLVLMDHHEGYREAHPSYIDEKLRILNRGYNAYLALDRENQNKVKSHLYMWKHELPAAISACENDINKAPHISRILIRRNDQRRATLDQARVKRAICFQQGRAVKFGMVDSSRRRVRVSAPRGGAGHLHPRDTALVLHGRSDHCACTRARNAKRT